MKIFMMWGLGVEGGLPSCSEFICREGGGSDDGGGLPSSDFWEVTGHFLE